MKILEAARDIIKKQGVEGLSIRKITSAIDYSPAIIYHYFKDKNEILETLTMEGYQQIIARVKEVVKNESQPEEELQQVFTGYIKSALASPEEYKAFMLTDNPVMLKRTSILKEGISKDSQTIKMLCTNIHKGIECGSYRSCDPELTAQIIWTSTFGLIIKIIMEKDVNEDQINRLIQHHFTLLLGGLMKNDSK